jgi:hypothetical protein
VPLEHSEEALKATPRVAQGNPVITGRVGDAQGRVSLKILNKESQAVWSWVECQSRVTSQEYVTQRGTLLLPKPSSSSFLFAWLPSSLLCRFLLFFPSSSGLSLLTPSFLCLCS